MISIEQQQLKEQQERLLAEQKAHEEQLRLQQEQMKRVVKQLNSMATANKWLEVLKATGLASIQVKILKSKKRCKHAHAPLSTIQTIQDTSRKGKKQTSNMMTDSGHNFSIPNDITSSNNFT